MGQLDNRTAVITGGGTGIGRAIARCFHDEGAFVAVAGRRTGPLDETVAMLGGTDRAMAVTADVTDDGDIAALFDAVADTAGSVDILVNNAGVMRFHTLAETPLDEWDLMMRTNTWGPWRTMIHAAPHMLRTGGGSIVNISSIAGIKAFPGVGAYCASKAALQTISQVMAMEYARENIRVNCILPALVEDTELSNPIFGERNVHGFWERMRELHPMGRNGKPVDIAEAALFFASERSSWITGVLMSVDGGRHMATNRPAD